MNQLLKAVALGLSVGLSWSASAQSQTTPPPAAEAPEWWSDHVDYMSANGGRWVAPNPAGLDDPETPDAYGMTWVADDDGYLLIGRLYGLEDGVETQEFWTFREFWHPGERRVAVQQWGDAGIFGDGYTTSSASGQTETDQTFWLSDGRSWREGHRAIEGEDAYVTESFQISADGVWTSSSKFTWRRVTPDSDGPD